MQAEHDSGPKTATQGFWRAVLAGLCATLVGIGLARFAYTPLIPALIENDYEEKFSVGLMTTAPSEKGDVAFIVTETHHRPCAVVRHVTKLLGALIAIGGQVDVGIHQGGHDGAAGEINPGGAGGNLNLTR